MNTAPTTAPVHLLAPDLAVRLGQILTALLDIIAARFSNPLFARQINRLRDRLSDAIRRFEHEAARHAAGLPDTTPQPAPPCPDRAAPRRRPLPTRHGGLDRILGGEEARFGSQPEHPISQPDVAKPAPPSASAAPSCACSAPNPASSSRPPRPRDHRSRRTRPRRTRPRLAPLVQKTA